MTRTGLRSRAVLAVFGGVLILGIAGVIVAGLHQHRGTAFTAEVQPTEVVAELGRAQAVCEGPIRLASAVRGVTVWTQAPLPLGTAVAIVRPIHGGAPLVRAPLRLETSFPAVAYGSAAHATFAATVAAGRSVSVCVDARQPVNLLGGAVSDVSGALALGGRPSRLALSLVFDAPRAPTVLAQVPTILRRAALLRPGWVGRWTFWALMAALVAAVGLLGRGLLAAAAADDPDDEPR